MGRMTVDVRQRVVNMWRKKVKLKDIQSRLKEEDITVSKTSLCLLIKKYKETGTVADRQRPPSVTKKLKLHHLVLIDEALAKDDEITNGEIRNMLREETGLLVSISTIQRAKRHLGKCLF